MSFNLTVVVKDGAAEVTEVSQVPDGIYAVQGHDGPDRDDLGVTRRRPDGSITGAAHSSHYKET